VRLSLFVSLRRHHSPDPRSFTAHSWQACYEQYASLASHPSVVAQFKRRALRFEQSLCAAVGFTDPQAVRAAGGRVHGAWFKGTCVPSFSLVSLSRVCKLRENVDWWWSAGALT
jgi:hypothetical protein